MNNYSKNSLKNKLYFTISIIAVIIFLIVSTVILGINLVKQNPKAQDYHIIYIHGWAANPLFSEKPDIEILRKIFPSYTIECFKWNARSDFDQCLKNADRVSLVLAHQIAAMPPAERRKIVLIGHSLGGRIVIRTMAKLKKQNCLIHRGIFLAAAIPNDDQDIASAISCSVVPNINVFNRQDYTLRHIYGMGGENLKNALGAYGYANSFGKKDMEQYEVLYPAPNIYNVDKYIAQLDNHDSIKYFRFVQEILPQIYASSKNNPQIDNSTSVEFIKKINVLQDRLNNPVKIVDVSGKTLKNVKHWRLQKLDSIFKGTMYRIIDPQDYQRAWGSKTQMEKSFNHIIEQLEAIAKN